MMILSFLRILTSYLLKIAMQLSSQSWANEIKEPVLKASRAKADWALSLREEERGSKPRSWDCILAPLAERTTGPFGMEVGLQMYGISEDATKVPVAPESRIAVGEGGGGTTTTTNARISIG
jgi:hypothetical protein